MPAFLAVIALVMAAASHTAYADQFTDYYYAAKRTVNPLLFQRADYLADTFGSPFLFPEKPVDARALVGIATDVENATYVDEQEYVASGQHIYEDSTVSSWVFDATDLAIQVVHWKTMLMRLNIPMTIWRDALIAYEDYQLARIIRGQPLDTLPNINYQGAFEVDSFWPYYYNAFPRETDDDGYILPYHTQEPFGPAILQNTHIKNIESNTHITDAEVLFMNFYDATYQYILLSQDQSKIFLICEPTCECGNGFFSIAMAVEPQNSMVNIIFEFGYRVCLSSTGHSKDDLDTCNATHHLGTGQRIYLAGDYRYQIVSDDGYRGSLRAVRFRDEDMNGRTLIFSNTGHQILDN